MKNRTGWVSPAAIHFRNRLSTASRFAPRDEYWISKASRICLPEKVSCENEFSPPVFLSPSYWYSRVVLPRITTIEISVVIINGGIFFCLLLLLLLLWEMGWKSNKKGINLWKWLLSLRVWRVILVQRDFSKITYREIERRIKEFIKEKNGNSFF